MKNSQPLAVSKDNNANFQTFAEFSQKMVSTDLESSKNPLKNIALPTGSPKLEVFGKTPLKYFTNFFGNVNNRFQTSIPAQSNVVNGVANSATNYSKSSTLLSAKADERQITSLPIKYTKSLVGGVVVSSGAVAAASDKSTVSLDTLITKQSHLQDKTLNHPILPSALATQVPRDLNLAINRINIHALPELTEQHKKNKEEEKEKEEAIMTQIRGDALPLATLEAFADPDYDEIEVPWLMDSSAQQSRHNHKNPHKATPQASSDEQRTSHEQSTPHQQNTAQTPSGDHAKMVGQQNPEHPNASSSHVEKVNHLSPTEYLQAYLNQTRLEPSDSIQNVTSSPKI